MRAEISPTTMPVTTTIALSRRSRCGVSITFVVAGVTTPWGAVGPVVATAAGVAGGAVAVAAAAVGAGWLA